MKQRQQRELNSLHCGDVRRKVLRHRLAIVVLARCSAHDKHMGIGTNGKSTQKLADILVFQLYRVFSETKLGYRHAATVVNWPLSSVGHI